MRDADNSGPMLDQISNLMGSKPQIISGDEEAALAARGVQLACPGRYKAWWPIWVGDRWN